MSLLFIEGPAGTGKTTRLMLELAASLRAKPLDKYQRVLALTKIHGSRRRMQQQLIKVRELSGRYDCMTADSYARRLIGRWRSLSCKRFGNVPRIDDHDEFCERAAQLISENIVGHWIKSTYPIVIVDEMQDSKAGQLRMIKMLERTAMCLAAADDFQDLETDGENDAVSWARANGQVITLSKIHRTNVEGLLNAAQSIRGGRQIENGRAFTIECVPAFALGAWHVSKHISKWRKVGKVAIITPTGLERSSFVKKLIARVESGPIGGKWKYGPHSIPWELSHQAILTELLHKLGLPVDFDERVRVDQLQLDAANGPSRALVQWFNRKRRVSNRTEFTVEEISSQMNSIIQRMRAYGPSWNKGVSAMTVHQAKNREFDSVIVLWPVEIQGSFHKQSRLLYNAITRAKKQALVIIQDPQSDRLEKPPFAETLSDQDQASTR